MSELVVLMGPPASGKSTYSEQLRGQGYDVVSVDAIRQAHGIAPGTANLEAFTIAYRATEHLLAGGQNVVFDSTAITANVRKRLRHIAKRHGHVARLVVIHADPSTCKRRNSKRDTDRVDDARLALMLQEYEREYPVAVAAERWSSVKVVAS